MFDSNTMAEKFREIVDKKINQIFARPGEHISPFFTLPNYVDADLTPEESAAKIANF